jgi:hypothetical protein
MNGWARLVALSLLLAGASAHAQTPMAKRIEADLKQTLGTVEGQTTRGAMEAYGRAAQAYAREIKRVFERLQQGLPPGPKQAAVESQRAWLIYLEAQRQVTGYISDAPGTIHRVAGTAALKEVLRHRLQELCELFLWSGLEETFSDDVPGSEFWCGQTHAWTPVADPLSELAGDGTPISWSPKKP